MNWQPIETAPKDGRLILIAERDGRVQIAKWAREPWGTNSDWYVQLTSSGADTYPTVDVTHWAPLLAPPHAVRHDPSASSSSGPTER